MRLRQLFSSFIITTLLFDCSTAILVAPQSQCQVKCGNVLGSTDSADIACGDYIYDTQPGATMKSCMECELQSGYKEDGGISDMQALLYNIRYTANHCIFNDTKVGESPCVTEFACGRFKKALEWNQLKIPTEGSGYEYCEDWDDNNLFKCQNCLGQLGGQHTLFNYMTALSIACKQRPVTSKTLEIEGSLFDGDPVKGADPNAKNAAIASTFHPPTGLSLTAKIGIAVGGVVVFLMVAGCCIICRGRKKRRKFLREHSEKYNKFTGDGATRHQMQMRYQDSSNGGGYFGDQKRGFDDSPQELHSAAAMSAPANRWESLVSLNSSPVNTKSSNKLIHGSPYISQNPTMSNVGLSVQPPPQSTSRQQEFSPYISHAVSPVSPAVMEPPRNGQWGAVPIPRAYRRGSIGSLPGRVAAGEDIEMHSIEISPTDPPSARPQKSDFNQDRDLEKGRSMDSVADFGRSPMAKSVAGSFRSGKSARSFRDRVEADERLRTASGVARFVSVPSRSEARSPPISMANRHYGHQRSASIESIGEAL